MLFAKKYQKEFLNLDETNKSLKGIIDRIIKKEEEYKCSCIYWSTIQQEDFLKSVKSISPNTLSRGYTLLKSFARFICENENIEFNEEDFKLEFGRLYELVDWKKILSKTLSYDELKIILSKLINVRDRVIIELGWLLLSNEEIKKLKKCDIEFTENMFGMKNAILKISEDRTIIVDDPEVAEDIEKCLKTIEYTIHSKDLMEKNMSLKQSDDNYLIKPTVVGQTGKEGWVVNPSITLQSSLKQQQVACPGINVEKLTIEDIKRSKVVYMLANKDFFTKDDIIKASNAGNRDSYIYWLSKIADKKYEKKDVQ